MGFRARPRLLLSSTSLNLGSGDETVASNTILALSNAGGSMVNWAAQVDETWLQITPQKGSIPSGQHMSAIVAATRSNLVPGTYTASILFTSNTGQISLKVRMTVIALQASHKAIMLLSTATLSYIGPRGEPSQMPR